MYHLVPLLSTILPIVASTLLLSVIIINLFLKIRRKFPISVNCWFCNSWTKVPYDDRNSFDCPTCLQYNGFTKDGGYNKIIPEQHDELMNKSTRFKSNKTVSNGLCALCNNNQQLKIFQLANFVPMNEENYDVEIEHFQEQLDKAYKLCKKCDRVLKQTLDKQNAWIFGNRVKTMCANGISKLASQIKKESQKTMFGKIDGFLSSVLVMGVIFTTLSSMKFLTKYASKQVPAPYLPIFNTIVSMANSSNHIEFTFFNFFSKNIKIEPYSVLCGVGLVFQSLKIMLGNITATKVNQVFCWVILFLITWVRHSKNHTSYVLFFEAFSCVYLLATAFARDDAKKTGKTMRKLVKNLDYTCSDVTESDFDTSSSLKNCSSDYLNKSCTAGHLLNSSFASAKTSLTNFDTDLNKSLNNLHLGGLGFKSPKNGLKRPKPVLSPPKFQTVNSWVAGGFWRDDGLVVPVAQRTNLSRSSSESSGFGSQHNDFVIGNPKGDFEKLSMTSEFTRLSPSPTFPMSPIELRRSNVFYPNFQQNFLFNRVGTPGLIKYGEPSHHRFQNWSDRVNAQATQSFKDLSLSNTNKTFNL